MTDIYPGSDLQALIFAPHGRDATVASSLLEGIGMTSRICGDLDQFCTKLGQETSFAVVTEEELRSTDLRAIAAWVEAQPSWSDLPFIILTRHSNGPDRSPAAARLSEVLRNVTLLERPFHPTTFISVAHAAFKTRQRQHDARARIEELHESQERLRTALLAGRLGSWELALDTWDLTASPTYKALFGRDTDASFSYEDLIAAIHPDDRTHMKKAVHASLENGRDFEIEYRTVWPNGAVHWIEARARVVDDVGGRLQLVGVSLDITGRKSAEANMRQINETLEERVLERTAELREAHEKVIAEIGQRERAEDQLRQAQKMEMIGQLTGGVAHDFNNLLMVVLGNLNMLRKRVPDDPRITRLIDVALQGAQRGASLTQRLLAFARRQDLEIEPRNLIDLVNGMTDLLRRSIGSRIELQIQMPDSLPLALVDANQLELALLNLVVNARDAMPDGGALSIKADRTEARNDGDLPDGRYVRLVVSDTGLGMDADTLRRATEPFFSTKGVGKGTGLGLSMIHGLIMQLNGALRLYSEPGRGTTVELWLPATSIPARLHKTPVLKVENTAPKLTVLVVDDDALIATSTVDMLEDLGHEAINVDSGATALELLQESDSIDLLITDYSMPKMTGVELAVAVRELKPDLPILLATGYAELPQDVQINLPRLGKPYQLDQLEAEITKLMKAHAA